MKEEIQKKIAKGSVDIAIGTHKILGQPGWKNLGLLIIDEEQKFGVSHKEKFKKKTRFWIFLLFPRHLFPGP